MLKQNAYQIDDDFIKADKTIILLCMSFLLYGLNTIVDYVIIILFVAVLLKFAYSDKLMLLCAPLMFFDYVLELPIGGSFFRIYAMVYLISFLVRSRGRISLTSKVIFAIAYFIFNIVCKLTISNILSSAFTVFVVCAVIDELVDNEKKRQLLLSITIAAVASAVFAFLRGTTMVSGDFGERLAGTNSDPNFSSMMFVLGIMSTLFCDVFTRLQKVVIIVVLCVALVLTVSMTGFVGIVILILISMYLKRPSKGVGISILLLLLLIVFFNVNINTDSFLYSLQFRLKETYDALLIKDYTFVTTNRSDMWVQYLDIYSTKIPFVNCIFGGIDATSREFRSMYGVQFASHNTFIDMLFMCGIVGFLAVLLWLVFSIKAQLVNYNNEKNNENLGLIMIKLTLLYYSFFLSYFGSKLFTFGLLI